MVSFLQGVAPPLTPARGERLDAMYEEDFEDGCEYEFSNHLCGCRNCRHVSHITDWGMDMDPYAEDNGDSLHCPRCGCTASCYVEKGTVEWCSACEEYTYIRHDKEMGVRFCQRCQDLY